MKNKTVIYLVSTFIWTWSCWISAYVLTQSFGYNLQTDINIFDLFAGFSHPNELFVQLIFFLGVFGPLIGFIVTGSCKNLKLFPKFNKKYLLFVLLIPLLYSIPTIFISIFTGYFNPIKEDVLLIASSIVLYFVSNFITSGTEEFGWRGYLYNNLKTKEKSFWTISWKGGLIWGLWHYPLLFIMYFNQGLMVLIPSLIGFTASIVAMNFITNYIYKETRSLPLVMTLHTLNNTSSYIIILLFPKTPFLILSNIFVWFLVWVIDKKYVSKEEKKT